MTLGSLLTLPSLALQTSAKALRMLALANEVLAARLAPPPDSGQNEVTGPTFHAPPSTGSAASAAADDTAAEATAAVPAEELPRDIPTLAGLPAPAVVDALDGLSLAQLDELYDYESNHRRRRTVLTAIEVALAPPRAAEDDDVLLDDVRVPDELVYSTVTPRR